MPEYLPDRIFADEDTVRELADSGATPFYLYNEAGIEESIRGFHASFSWLEGHRNYMLLRDNPNPEILKLLQRTGCGIHVTGLSELSLALSCGFTGDHVIYEPTRKDPEAEALAHETGAVWMVDSANLIPDVLPKRLFLRVYPSELPLERSQINGFKREKCGFNEDDLLECMEWISKKEELQLGLAVQMSDYSIKPGFWVKKTKYLLQRIQWLQKKFDKKICAIHIGEGLGLPFRPSIPIPDINEDVAAIRDILDKMPQEDRPILFTGLTRRLLLPNGILVTKVLEERKLLHSYLIVDAGFCQFPRAVVRQCYRHVSVLGDREMTGRKVYAIAGVLPDAVDRAVYRTRTIPRVKTGDYCIMHDVGCCGRCMSVLYGMQPLAAEYMYCADGSVRMIARARSSQEVMEFITAL